MNKKRCTSEASIMSNWLNTKIIKIVSLTLY